MRPDVERIKASGIRVALLSAIRGYLSVAADSTARACNQVVDHELDEFEKLIANAKEYIAGAEDLYRAIKSPTSGDAKHGR